MHYYTNRHVKHVLDGCSMLSGMLFQLNWNPVPTYLEQESILAVTRQELKKAHYKGLSGEERKMAFGSRKGELMAVIGCGTICLDGAERVSNVMRIWDRIRCFLEQD